MLDGLARDVGLTRGSVISNEVNNNNGNNNDSDKQEQQAFQVVTPFNYRSANLSTLENGSDGSIMNESMNQYISKCFSGHLRGRVVYLNMVGFWNFTRTIINHFDSSQSGTVDGRASFLPISSTDSSFNDPNSVLESLLYHEEGIFTLNRSPPLQFTIQREDHYSYNSLSDSIDIYFIKNSLKGDHFLTLRFNNKIQNNNNEDEVNDKWWCAESDHWCSPDNYTAKYKYSFSGINLSQILIEIDCKGPNKDYKTITTYSRPIQSNNNLV